jgi:hypothetical protein
VAPHELAEGVGIPRAGAIDEVAVGQRGHAGGGALRRDTL